MNFLGVHKNETPISASSKRRVQKMSMMLMKLMSVHHSLKNVKLVCTDICVIEKRNSEEENNESERGTYESRGGN